MFIGLYTGSFIYLKQNSFIDFNFDSANIFNKLYNFAVIDLEIQI